jgi:signal transduction histidine kinase
VRLADWQRRLFEEYEPEMREQGIAFSSRIEGETAGMATVRIDGHRMDRVLANLIYNAMKHTPKGGAVTLIFKADEARNLAQIEVADTGPGIHPDDLPHLFERFYKSGKTRHSSSGGSGLGLSIAREIVETHDGHLSAANGDAGGSVFKILLPLHAVAGPEAS